MIIEIYIAFVSFILSIMLHELGHFIYLRFHLKKDVEIRFFVREKAFLGVGKEEDYKDLTPQQLRGTYIWGIGLGYFPLIFLTFVNHWLALVFWCLYFVGIKKDFVAFIKTYNKEKT